MALRPVVHKLDLDVADLDRERYASYKLVLTREPSEPDERLVARIAAFALNADEALSFSAAMADTEEPALALRDLEGRIRLWIEVGTPEPKRLKKAASRADSVLLYLYHGRSGRIWWDKNRAELESLDKLRVYEFDPEGIGSLAALVDKGMELSCSIQDGQLGIAHSGGMVELGVVTIK